MEAASIRLGFSRDYFRAVVKRGLIPEHTMQHMSKEFGIRPEDIEREPEPEKDVPAEQPAQDEAAQVTMQELLALTKEIKAATAADRLQEVIGAIDTNFLPIREAVEGVVQRKHKIATMSNLTGDTIAMSVRDGLKAWWNTYSPQVRTLIADGVLDAIRKAKESEQA